MPEEDLPTKQSINTEPQNEFIFPRILGTLLDWRFELQIAHIERLIVDIIGSENLATINNPFICIANHVAKADGNHFSLPVDAFELIHTLRITTGQFVEVAAMTNDSL